MPSGLAYDAPAHRLNVTTRARNILREEGLETIGQVVAWAHPENRPQNGAQSGSGHACSG